MQELARVSEVLLVNEKCFFDRNGTNFSDFEQKFRQKQQKTAGGKIQRILAKVSNFSKFVKEIIGMVVYSMTMKNVSKDSPRSILYFNI